MKFKIHEHEGNYTGTIVEISNLMPVDGLNKLVRTSIFGADVLVGIDTKLGDVGVFFPSETVLSDKFLHANNLYRHAHLNADPQKSGFFEDNGRCKAIKFKGVVSTGFFIPVNSLESFCDITKLKINDTFQDINDVNICRKYRRKERGLGTQKNNKPKEFKLTDLVDERAMPEHYDTDNLYRNMHKLNLGDLISVTIKIHGTSLRVSRNIVYKPSFADLYIPKISGKGKTFNLLWKAGILPKIHNLIYKLSDKLTDLKRKFNVKEFEYQYIAASRRVIKSIGFNELEGKQHFYGDADVWTTAAKLFDGKLHKGENLYAEIIGYTRDGAEIQKDYNYGVPHGEFEVYIYRISRTNEDGVSQDLPYPLLKQRCAELGVKVVPLVFYGELIDFIQKYTNEVVDERNYLNLLEQVVKDNFMDKPSIFNSADWQNVEEGIVMVKEQLGTFYALKAKSPLFLEKESKNNDKGIVDIEEEGLYDDLVGLDVFGTELAC